MFSHQAPPKSKGPPEDMVRDLAAILELSLRVWSMDSTAVESFNHATLQLQQAANVKIGTEVDPARREWIGQLNGVRAGWRSGGGLQKLAASALTEIAKLPGSMSDEDFSTGLALLLAICQDGSLAARAFHQFVRQLPADWFDQYAKSAWAGFAERANDLFGQLATLGSKANRHYSASEPYHVPRIDTL